MEGPFQLNSIWKISDFFVDQIRYKSSEQEFKDNQFLKNKTDIELECLGYGIFDLKRVYKNFYQYLNNIFQNCPKIKSLKIVFNGFDMTIAKGFTDIICNYVHQKQSLKTVWIHTSHLYNCSITDFQNLFKIAFMCDKQDPIEEISLQFNNWKFIDGPQTLNTIQQIFQKHILQHSSNLQPLTFKKFRLQMSGWYYQNWAAKRFLKCALSNKQYQKLEEQNEGGLNQSWKEGQYYENKDFEVLVGRFHEKIKKLVESLLEALTQIEDFQLDLRAWNDILKMKQLKKILDNAKKGGRRVGSLISKRGNAVLGENQGKQKKPVWINITM